ncbi:MAG TPA: J domain-containing protein [Planctomycetaceae bacterium]|nr:J domain-containing protein [Planctomycetaceae bacterium]
MPTMRTMAQDYYKLLEVSRSASPEEIQKAYRRLARKYHPDLNPNDKSAQQRFKDVQHAYDVLNDPEKRRMYDQVGPDFERMGGNPFAGTGGPFGGSGGTASFEEMFGSGDSGNQRGGFGFGGIDELLRRFTGGGGSAGASGGRTRRAGRGGATQGSDLRAELVVPFNTAVLGGAAAVSVLRGGKEETLQLKVPPGITTGKKMRLRGQGNPGTNGGANGDLIVHLQVAPHPYFQRNDNNLELRLPITLKEAVLGATVDVPTPSGTVSLKIPPGSSGGRRLRIKGRGVLNPNGAPGDLYVELQVRLPDRTLTSDQQPELLVRAAEELESMYREPVRGHIRW